MGSTSSKGEKHQQAAEYGQIYVKTDRPSYFGGESVTGQIHINLTKPFPGKQLFLRLKGREVVHLIVSRGDQHNHHKEANLITNLFVPVYTWDSSPIAGQYTIPFSFLLPTNLPSTFHQEGHKYLATLYYRLEALLEPDNKWVHPRVKHKQKLIVKSPLVKADGERRREITREMSSFCFQGGQIVFSAKLDKKWYFPEETVQVLVSLDNTKCTVDNLRVYLTLKQRITLKCLEHTSTFMVTKVEAMINGVRKGQLSVDKDISLKLPPFKVGDYRNGKRDNMIQYLLLDQYDGLIHSATKGKLISSEYFLEVTSHMDDSCSDTPRIIFPIEVCHPDVELPEIAAPADWHPVQMENVNLVFAPPINEAPFQNDNAGMNMVPNNMSFQVSDEERASLYQPPPQFNNPDADHAKPQHE